MFSYGFLSWFRGDPSILTMVAPLNAQIDLSAIHPTSMWVLAPFHLAGGLLSHPERCQKLEWGIRITDYNCWLEVGSCVYHFGNSHSHMCHMIKHKQLGVSFVLKRFLKCYSMLFHVIHVLFMLFPLSEMIRRDLNFSWLWIPSDAKSKRCLKGAIIESWAAVNDASHLTDQSAEAGSGSMAVVFQDLPTDLKHMSL